jgi:hypothetical protein
MYIEQILPQKIADKTSFHELTHTESQQNYPQPEKFNISDLALTIALTPLSFVFIWVIFLFIWEKIRSNLHNKIDFSIHDIHQVPCKNCKFFANNHYLRCAVQPNLVCTEEAINCTEYDPNDSEPPAKKFFNWIK